MQIDELLDSDVTEVEQAAEPRAVERCALTRTLNTSITTISTMIVVCVVAVLTGVTSIVSFALPMIVGLIVGVYSSVCIASPLWAVWQTRKGNGNSKKKQKAAS